MSFIRSVGAALLALAATSPLHAQNVSLSMLGLTSLSGASDEAPKLLGFKTLSALNVSALPSGEEAEELPAPQRGDISLLPAFVPECLVCWKEQWKLGHYREAELLATIACRWDPTNVTAQHALAISELMVALTSNTETTEDAGICPLLEKLVSTVVGAQCKMGEVAFTRNATAVTPA